MRMKCPHHGKFFVRDLDVQDRFATDFGLTIEERMDDGLVMPTRGGDMVPPRQCCDQPIHLSG